jgi:hypothetical protein
MEFFNFVSMGELESKNKGLELGRIFEVQRWKVLQGQHWNDLWK